MEKKEPHPILVNDELINERGVVVFDHIHGLPVCGEPYIAPYFVISLNMKGWARLEYDMRDMRFEKNDVAIVNVNHSISSISSSPDYHSILLVMSSRPSLWAFISMCGNLSSVSPMSSMPTSSVLCD